MNSAGQKFRLFLHACFVITLVAALWTFVRKVPEFYFTLTAASEPKNARGSNDTKATAPYWEKHQYFVERDLVISPGKVEIQEGAHYLVFQQLESTTDACLLGVLLLKAATASRYVFSASKRETESVLARYAEMESLNLNIHLRDVEPGVEGEFPNAVKCRDWVHVR